MAEFRILIALLLGITLGVVGAYAGTMVPRSVKSKPQPTIATLKEQTIYLDTYNNIEVTSHFDEANVKGAEQVYLLNPDSSRKQLIYTRELPTGAGIQLPIHTFRRGGSLFYLIGYGWQDYAIINNEGTIVTDSILNSNNTIQGYLSYYDNPEETENISFNVFNISGKRVGYATVNPQNGKVIKNVND
jgi:hypothetical protein